MLKVSEYTIAVGPRTYTFTVVQIAANEPRRVAVKLPRVTLQKLTRKQASYVRRHTIPKYFVENTARCLDEAVREVAYAWRSEWSETPYSFFRDRSNVAAIGGGDESPRYALLDCSVAGLAQMRDMTYENIPCVHCERLYSEHVRNACMFSPGTLYDPGEDGVGRLHGLLPRFEKLLKNRLQRCVRKNFHRMLQEGMYRMKSEVPTHRAVSTALRKAKISREGYIEVDFEDRFVSFPDAIRDNIRSAGHHSRAFHIIADPSVYEFAKTVIRLHKKARARRKEYLCRLVT